MEGKKLTFEPQKLEQEILLNSILYTASDLTVKPVMVNLALSASFYRNFDSDGMVGLGSLFGDL